MDAHRLERRLDADLGRVQLRHPSLEVGATARVERRGGPPRQQPRGLHLRGHVSELELDGLKLRDGLAERAALPRVRQRPVEARLRNSDRAPCDIDAPKLQYRQRLLQPMTFLTPKQVLDRYVAVAQEHLGRFRALVANLV